MRHPSLVLEPISLWCQNRQKTSGYTASWTEQLQDSWGSCSDILIGGLTRSQSMSHSGEHYKDAKGKALGIDKGDWISPCFFAYCFVWETSWVLVQYPEMEEMLFIVRFCAFKVFLFTSIIRSIPLIYTQKRGPLIISTSLFFLHKRLKQASLFLPPITEVFDLNFLQIHDESTGLTPVWKIQTLEHKETL